MTKTNKWFNNGEGLIVSESGDIAEVISKNQLDTLLIAAAPELLEALQSIMSGVARCEREPRWESARAAIAKATGVSK